MTGSGRRLLSTTEFASKRRLRGDRASIEVDGQALGEVESRWVRSALRGVTKVRHTTVTFRDGIRWTIATGPPDEPPEPRVVLGRTRPGFHSAGSRIVRVRDERGRVLGKASWPEPSADARQRVEEETRDARSNLKRSLLSVRASTAHAFSSKRHHRKGRFKWLIVASALFFLVLGFLPASVATLALGETGPGIAFGIVTAIAAVLGALSLRRWRDVAHCWSCGRPNEDNPGECPFCEAPKPRSAGFRQAMAPFAGGGRAAGDLLARTAGKLVGVPRHPRIEVAGAAYVLSREENPTLLTQRHRLGDVLTIISHSGSVTFTPAEPVSMEAALLSWHIVKGDIFEPSG